MQATEQSSSNPNTDTYGNVLRDAAQYQYIVERQPLYLSKTACVFSPAQLAEVR